MDKIGSSDIAPIDAIICLVAFALISGLGKLPPNSIACRVLVVVVGCCVFGLILVLFLADLTSDGVFELAVIAMFLTFRLWEWNDERVKPRVTQASPPVSK